MSEFLSTRFRRQRYWSRMVVPIRIVHTANLRNLTYFFNIVIFEFCLVQNQKNDVIIWEIFRGWGWFLRWWRGDSFLEDRTVTLSGSERCCRVTPEWRTLVRTESELVRGKLLVGGIRQGNGGGRILLAGPRRNLGDFVLSGQLCRTFSADLMID